MAHVGCMYISLHNTCFHGNFRGLMRTLHSKMVNLSPQWHLGRKLRLKSQIFRWGTVRFKALKKHWLEESSVVINWCGFYLTEYLLQDFEKKNKPNQTCVCTFLKAISYNWISSVFFQSLCLSLKSCFFTVLPKDEETKSVVGPTSQIYNFFPYYYYWLQ